MASPLAGVQVTADNGGTTLLSDASGNYDAWVPDDWTGTVTPTLAEHTFSPTSRAYANVTADITSKSTFSRLYWKSVAPWWRL